MNAQKQSTFFCDYFHITAEQQQIIDDYYSIIADEFSFKPFYDQPREFWETVQSESIILSFFQLINKSVFNLVKEWVEKQEAVTFETKSTIKQLCDKRIQRFEAIINDDNYLRNDVYYFCNELDQVSIKGKTKADIAKQLLELLLKNTQQKPKATKNFFIDYLSPEVKRFSTEQQTIINAYYSILCPNFDIQDLGCKNLTDSNVILKVICQQITEQVFMRARELIKAKAWQDDNAYYKIMAECNFRFTSEPTVIFPKVRFNNELDFVDFGKEQQKNIDEIAAEATELLLKFCA